MAGRSMSVSKSLAPLLLTFLLTPAASPASAQVDKGRQHLERGRALVSAGDTVLAFAELEQAVDAAPDLADAHFELGRLYTHRASAVETDFRDRKKAEEALLRALELNPDDPRYLLELGRLRLKQHMKIDAERLLKLSLEKAKKRGDPATLAEVEFNLGYIQEHRYASMRDRRLNPLQRGPPTVDVHRMADPRPARYLNRYLRDHGPIEGHGEVTKQRMLEHYRGALRADPAHVAAATRLMGYLLDAQQLSEYLAVARRLLASNPDRPEPHLYLGLGYHRAGREDDAAEAFRKALARLPEEDRAAIQNLTPVLRREDAEAYRDMEEEQRERYNELYWRLKDPLYLTAANEGRLEHMARVAYADLRYSAPSAGHRGWETDRGVIFIRYGPPEESGTFGATASNRGDPYAVGRRSIIWSYGREGPVFVFRQMPGYLDARFAGDYEFIAEEYRYYEPSRYENIPSIPELLDVPVQVARFRGESPEDLAVEIHAGLPVDSLARGLDVERGEIEVGLFVLNPDGEMVLRQVRSELLTYGEAEHVDELRSWRVLMPAGGSLVAAVEARDALSWRSAASRDTFTAEPFPEGSFSISDILVADALRPVVEEPKRRSDFDVIANPELEFISGDPVHIYWELYELEPDPEGFASYDVALAVRVKKLERGNNPLSQFLGTLADAWGFSVVGDDRLELRFNREVRLEGLDRVVEFLRLDLKGAPAGEYEIRLRVWDRNAEKMATRMRAFVVADRETE